MKTTFLYICSIIILVLLFLNSGCFNVDINTAEKLPPITQEGNNTFGCLIDGKLFHPGTTLNGNVRPLTFSYFRFDTDRHKAGSLYIQGIDARYSLPIAGRLAIQKKEVFSAGTFQLKSQECSPTSHCDLIFYYNSDENTNYIATSGELIITRFDTVHNIVSGTFEFEAESGEGEKIKVTSGRFDAEYSEY